MRHILAILSLLAVGVFAQTCSQSESNDHTLCQPASLPGDTSTLYFSPTESGDIELFGAGYGTCVAGSYATVTFYSGYDYGTGSLLANCGCLPLDGSAYVLDCGIDKATIPEGGYHFVITVNSQYAGVARFNVVHTQKTVTAATPTSTATIFTTKTVQAITTSTATNTETSSQITVKTPGTTIQKTRTITPRVITTRVTQTATKTFQKTKHQYLQTYVTTTADHCVKLKPCTAIAPRGAQHQRRGSIPGGVVPGANGYTVTGGDLTSTFTPALAIVTETDDGGTITTTDTAYTTVTTTIQPNPLTTTIPSGSIIASHTITLAAQTSTITHHTTQRTTVTNTFTVVYEHLVVVVPTCKAKRI